MKKFKLQIILFFSYAIAASLTAQESNGGSFSLQQAIEYAMKNSPSYLNSELDLKYALERKREITGTGLPQVSGSIDLKDYLAIPVSLIPLDKLNPTLPPNTYTTIQFGTKYNATAGFTASQLIFSSDYIFALRAQKEFLNLSKIAIDRTKSELIAQVTKAYYNVLVSRSRIRSLNANLVKLKKSYEDIKFTNQQGLVELIDVERLEVTYNNLLTELEKTNRLVGLTEVMLKFQMGLAADQPIALSDSLNVTEEGLQELGTGKVDISRRPEYMLLQAQQKLYDLDVKRTKYSFLPTLAAYGSYQYNAQRTTFNFFDFDKNDIQKSWFKVALVGVTLNLNIFTGFQRMARIEQAKITALKNHNTMRNLELASQMEATMAAIQYNNAFTSLQRQKKNMELAQHVLDVAQKKYESGVGSNIEVVNAQTSLTEAQTNYYNSVFDLVVAKTDFQKATGTLIK
jgi:outer membrane protein